MSIIDEYNLKASLLFPVSGTEEITKDLQLTESTVSATGVVTGTVTSGGSPVSGATVKIFDANDIPIAHDVTNVEGKFTIAGITPGSYKITATKPGYLTATAIPITVSPSQPTTVNISLTTDPDASKNVLYGIISQAVVFTPIEGATVNIYQDVGGVQTLALTTSTNVSGQYFAPRLPSGDYVVVANKIGYEQNTSALVTLSGSAFESLSLPLQVNAVQNVGTVSGIITDIVTTLPIPNACVALYQISGGTETIIKVTKTNSGGRYLFGDVVAGDYIVKVIAQTVTP